jgi:hypothetical protein
MARAGDIFQLHDGEKVTVVTASAIAAASCSR